MYIIEDEYEFNNLRCKCGDYFSQVVLGECGKLMPVIEDIDIVLKEKLELGLYIQKYIDCLVDIIVDLSKVWYKANGVEDIKDKSEETIKLIRFKIDTMFTLSFSKDLYLENKSLIYSLKDMFVSWVKDTIVVCRDYILNEFFKSLFFIDNIKYSPTKFPIYLPVRNAVALENKFKDFVGYLLNFDGMLSCIKSELRMVKSLNVS